MDLLDSISERVRQESIKRARILGVDVLETLPLLDCDVRLRSPAEVTSRLLTMNALAAVAYGFDRQKARKWLESEGLTDYLTADEERFVVDGVGSSQRYQNQVEGMWALAWALGIVDELDFSKGCADDFVFQFPNLKKNESADGFRNAIEPRPLEQILGATDLAYCLHWVIRQYQLTGLALPSTIHPVRIIERRRALEWLLSEDDWDDVLLDT